MYAARWVHKGIRGDNIIFSSLGLECNELYLSGFEYARPDQVGTYRTGRGPGARNEVYVYPKYQFQIARGTYQKTYDIYSLGIVLLELPYWQPIQEIMGFFNKQPRCGEVKRFHEQLPTPNSK
jgi:hypothetical protein